MAQSQSKSGHSYQQRPETGMNLHYYGPGIVNATLHDSLLLE